MQEGSRRSRTFGRVTAPLIAQVTKASRRPCWHSSRHEPGRTPIGTVADHVRHSRWSRVRQTQQQQGVDWRDHLSLGRETNTVPDGRPVACPALCCQHKKAHLLEMTRTAAHTPLHQNKRVTV